MRVSLKILAYVALALACLAACSTPSGGTAPAASSVAAISVTPQAPATAPLTRRRLRPSSAASADAPVAPDTRTPQQLALAACKRADGSWACPSIKPTLMASSQQPIIPPAWTVPNWYVDPANSTGCASNTNSCTSATCAGAGVGPCLIVAEVVSHRWGTPSPTLSQTTTLSILSGETVGQEAVILSPVLVGGTAFIVDGTPGEKLIATFNLGAVTGKVRTAGGTLLQAAGFVAAGLAVGQLVVNNHTGSHSTIQHLAAGTATLDQPLGHVAPTFLLAPAEDDAWSAPAGQSVSIYSLPILNLKVWSPTVQDVTSYATNGFAWVNGVSIPDVSGTPGTSIFAPNLGQSSVSNFQDCTIGPYLTTTGGFLNAGSGKFANCSLPGGAELQTGTVMGGDSNYLQLGEDGCVDLDHIAAGGLTTDRVGGNSFVGYCYVPGGQTIDVYPGTSFILNDDMNGTAGAALYGGAGLTVEANSALLNKAGGTWATRLLLTGALSMEDPSGTLTTAWSMPSTGTFTLNGASQVNVTGVNGTNAFPANATISWSLSNANGGTIGATGPQFSQATAANNFYVKGLASDTSIYNWVAGAAPGVTISAANLDIYRGLWNPVNGARIAWC